MEQITTRRRKGVGVVIGKIEKSWQIFNKNLCNLFTAIMHTEMLCALYKKTI